MNAMAWRPARRVRTLVRTEDVLSSLGVRLAMAAKRATARFEFRLDPEGKQAIAEAAAVLGMDASDFARELLLERAQEILAERARKTVVPAGYFEDLLAALDEPVQLNDAFRRATARAREVVRSPNV